MLICNLFLRNLSFLFLVLSNLLFHFFLYNIVVPYNILLYCIEHTVNITCAVVVKAYIQKKK